MAKEKKEKVKKEKVKKEKVQKEKKVKYSGKTSYDFGTVLIFCAFLIASIVLAGCSSDLYKENLIMIAVTFTVGVLAALKVENGAMILAAIQTVVYIGIRIASIASGGSDSKISFGWIFVPGLLVAGYTFINRAKREMELSHEVMNDQINELIMTDAVTGLYNLRSMYMDIQTQISYAERNNKQICLMILKPKYVDEMKKVLKSAEFKEVIIRLSKVVCDTVRLEDRVYSIDSEGGFGVILTCDLAGSRLVEERLAEKFLDDKLFSGVVKNNDIKIEMQLGCIQYYDGLERDAIKFKDMAQAALKDISLEEIRSREVPHKTEPEVKDKPKEDKHHEESTSGNTLPDDDEIEEVVEEIIDDSNPDAPPVRRVVKRKVISRRIIKREQ